jgi:hypothetical protein
MSLISAGSISLDSAFKFPKLRLRSKIEKEDLRNKLKFYAHP